MSRSFPNALHEQAVWVDTGFLFALQLEKDGLHARAAALWEHMLGEHVPLVLSAPILFETQRLLRFRGGFAAAQRFLQLYPRIFNLHFPGKEEIQAASELLNRLPDQLLTLTDALVGQGAAGDGARVATFDFSHFSLFDVRFYPAY